MNTSVGIADKPGEGCAAVSLPWTFLVVDDFDDDVELLRLMLRRSRVLNPVQAVSNVTDGIRYLEGNGIYADRAAYPYPMLLFLDMRLGNDCGFEVLRWLRSSGVPPVAVIVLTGSDTPMREQALELGALSFFEKPLRFHDFQNLIANAKDFKFSETHEGHRLDFR